MTELRRKLFLLLIILVLNINCCCAITDKNHFDIFNIMETMLSLSQYKEIEYKFVSKSVIKFVSAREKIFQGNTIGAEAEFNEIIDNINNDRELLNISKYLYSEGLYSLARKATNKIKDKDVFLNHIENLKNTYEINYDFTKEEENYLIKTYALSKYQNLSDEMAYDLKKQKKLLKESDYANYVMALCFYNLKQYKQAHNFIKTAINLNERNVNYRLLEAKILYAQNKYQDSLKIAKKLGFQKSVVGEDFIELKYKNLIQISKKPYEKKLYESAIAYIKNDYYKSIADANASISINNKNIDAYYLLYKNMLKIHDIEASIRIFNKMNAIDKNSKKTLEARGDLEFLKGRFYNALKCWKKSDTNSRLVVSKIMLANTILENTKENSKYAKKLDSLAPNEINENYEIATSLLNNSALVKNIQEYKYAAYSLKIYYLKTAITDEPFKLANWLEFTDVSVNKNKKINSLIITTASYLGDFNYYFYWVLANLEENDGDFKKALEYYNKSLNLNPLFEPSLKRVKELKL